MHDVLLKLGGLTSKLNLKVGALGRLGKKGAI